MDDVRISDFIEQILPPERPDEQELREFAAQRHIPIIRRETAALLRTLAALRRPQRILEIGTAIGYSAAVLAHVLPDSFIDTVEIDLDSVVLARENIRKMGFGERIRVIAGDGADVMASLRMPYDMIFLDAAKGQYLNLYEDAVRLLQEGGLLICDNCIFYGKVSDEPEQTPHKHRTIVANLRKFLEIMMGDPRLSASLLHVGDGVALACKIKGDCDG